METNTVSLECGVIELGAITQRKKRDTRLHSCNTAISFLGDQQQEEKQQLIRRVQSHHAGMKANLLGSSESFNYYGSAAMFGQDYSHLTAADALGDTQEKQQAEEETPNEQFHQVFVNFTSGLIAFLLSSTIAVSCASVVVGHGTPLSQYSSNFIDMNFLGSAVLSIGLAWKSYAPWTLGAIDVFV
jgi:hypothetical protein